MIFNKHLIVAVLLFPNVYCYDLEFQKLDIAVRGLAFPPFIEVYEGQNIMVLLKETVAKQEKCSLLTPSYETINLTTNAGRISKWTSECSVKIKEVALSDEGRWRLRSVKEGETLEGVFTVIVKKNTIENGDHNVINVDGAATSTINFSPYKSLYCSVIQDMSSEGSFIKGNCLLPIGKTRKNFEGNWKVTLALPGRVEEITSESVVNINSENLDVGVEIDIRKNVARLYCNLKNSMKTLDFCRFERKRDRKGFNLGDGIGNNRYSYFGNGLLNKECGITIEGPAKEDYGNWQCNLGYTEGSEVGTLKRILILEKPASRILDINRNSVKTTLAVLNKRFTVECNANMSISYCWLQHPNGSIFTNNFAQKIVNQTYYDQPYWFASEYLDEGICSVTFNESNSNDEGIWKCNMGQLEKTGVELVDFTKVRVGGALAALEPIVFAERGTTAKIKCVTAESRKALKYCRFFLPDGTGFNIDEKVTKKEAIMGLYYFDEDSALNRGECAIRIMGVDNIHIGNWTCAAIIEDDSTEYNDRILLQVTGNSISTASVTGISFGVIFVVVAFVGVAYYSWKRRNASAHGSRQRVEEPATTSGDVSIQYRPSGSSDTSSTELTTSPQIRVLPSYQGH